MRGEGTGRYWCVVCVCAASKGGGAHVVMVVWLHCEHRRGGGRLACRWFHVWVMCMHPGEGGRHTVVVVVCGLGAKKRQAQG